MLTERTIKNLKPKKAAYRERDKSNLPEYRGLCLKVALSGLKTFQLCYTFGDKRRFLTLGGYPNISLLEARALCKVARQQIARGVDPQMERIRQATAEELQRLQVLKNREITEATATLADLVELYLVKLDNPNTRKHVADLLDRDVLPTLGTKRLPEITAQHVKAVLATIHRRGAKRVYALVFGYLHAAFEFAKQIPRDGTITTAKAFPPITNPMRELKKPPTSTPGERHLSESDIQALWRVAQGAKLSQQVTTVFSLLLITGQRVQEVAGMRWSELDLQGKVWTIPTERIKTKSKRPVPHIVPLPLLAVRLLRKMPRRGPVIFPHNTDTTTPMPWRSLSQAATRLANRADIAQFSPKDIRRTVKTHMARLRIAKPIRDMVQNHAMGDVGSVHYDRWDGAPEKREALHKWTRELLRIINAKDRERVVSGNNVISFRKAS